MHFDANLIKNGWKMRKLLISEDGKIAFMGTAILNIYDII